MNKKMAINTYLSTIESKSKINRQNRNRLIRTETAVGRGIGGLGERGEGIKPTAPPHPQVLIDTDNSMVLIRGKWTRVEEWKWG